jgi:tyrosine-protein kinase Etk/Wzc
MGLMLDALKRIDERLSAEWQQPQPTGGQEDLEFPFVPPGSCEPTEAWAENLLNELDAAVAEVGQSDAGAAPYPAATPPASSVEPSPPTPEPPAAARTPYQDLAGRILAELAASLPRAVAFTSPTDGPETAAVLSRLAPVLAEQVDGGVLVLDADCHRPRLAAELGADPSPGLSEVLAGGTNWSDAVRPTAVPRLYVLPGGPIALAEGPPVEQADLDRLLRDLLRHYALVLVATSSLGHAEARAVAGACQGVYLVARLAEVTRPAVRQAAHLIQQCSARLLGCVAVGPAG